jgi:hypothetical protein
MLRLSREWLHIEGLRNFYSLPVIIIIIIIIIRLIKIKVNQLGRSVGDEKLIQGLS